MKVIPLSFMQSSICAQGDLQAIITPVFLKTIAFVLPNQDVVTARPVTENGMIGGQERTYDCRLDAEHTRT